MDNTDILREIAQYFIPNTYKNALLTCRTWYNIFKNREYERLHMNILSTLILRHPEIGWTQDYVSCHVTQEIIDLHIKQWYISHLSDNPYLSREFIITNWDKFNNTIYKNHALTLDIIKELIATNKIKFEWMECIMCNPNLDEAFIREHWDQYSEHLAFNKNTPFDLIEKIKNHFIPDAAENVNLTNEFIRAKLDYFGHCIDTLCENRALTLDIIRDYWKSHFAYHPEIYKNPNMTLEFIRELGDIDWSDVVPNPIISCSMIRELIANFDITPNYASWSRNLDAAFIRQYANELKWDVVVLGNKLSLEVAEEHIDHIYTAFR